MESHSFETLFKPSFKWSSTFLMRLQLERERPEFSMKLRSNPLYMNFMYQHHLYGSLFKPISKVRLSCQINLPTTCCACQINRLKLFSELVESPIDPQPQPSSYRVLFSELVETPISRNCWWSGAFRNSPIHPILVIPIGEIWSRACELNIVRKCKTISTDRNIQPATNGKTGNRSERRVLDNAVS